MVVDTNKNIIKFKTKKELIDFCKSFQFFMDRFAFDSIEIYEDMSKDSVEEVLRDKILKEIPYLSVYDGMVSCNYMILPNVTTSSNEKIDIVLAREEKFSFYKYKNNNGKIECNVDFYHSMVRDEYIRFNDDYTFLLKGKEIDIFDYIYEYSDVENWKDVKKFIINYCKDLPNNVK